MCENADMTLFLFVSFLICALVLGCLLFGTRTAARAAVSNSLSLNDERLSVFKDRRKELESDHHAGRLNERDYASALADLYDQLEREAPELFNTVSSSVVQDSSLGFAKPPVPAKTNAWVAAAIAASFLISVASYLSIGAPELTESAYRDELTQAQNQMKAGLSGKLAPTGDIEEVKKLLVASPNDASLWASLAKLERMGGNPINAVIAFEKASSLGLKSPEFLVDYAEAIAASKNGDFSGEPLAMLTQALKLAPDLPKAIALMGAAQLRLGNGEQAAIYLKRTLGFLEPGTPQAQAVQAALERMAPQAELPIKPFLIRGVATVDADLQSKLITLDPQQAAIFIAARSASRPMPIAALRLPLSALKNGSVSFELSAQNQLSSEPLKEQTELIIVARISANGTATKSAGDLVGTTSALPINTLLEPAVKTPLSIRINRVVGAGE